MDITNEIKAVRESVYGKDVRESIATALEKTYNDAGTSVEMEIVAARGTHKTLGDRFKFMEKNISEAEKKTAELVAHPIIVTDEIPENLAEGQICIVYTEENTDA